MHAAFWMESKRGQSGLICGAPCWWSEQQQADAGGNCDSRSLRRRVNRPGVDEPAAREFVEGPALALSEPLAPRPLGPGPALLA